jgi:hypothetical protein
MVTEELTDNLRRFVRTQLGNDLELAGVSDSDGHAGLTSCSRRDSAPVARPVQAMC